MSRSRTTVASLALALALACHERTATPAAPTDRFYFPTGLAVRHEPPGCVAGTAGCRTQLLVVSSNDDLRYDAAQGGTLISVDVDQALAQGTAPGAFSPVPVPVLGVAHIGSFGGELGIVDAETCPTWTGPAQALVASRDQVTLYRVDVASSGDLSCGNGCVVPLDETAADPFGVTVACGSFPPALGEAPAASALAFITYLRSADAHGWLSQIDLLATGPDGSFSSPSTLLDLQIAPTGHTEFDPDSARLYVTGRFAQAGYTPLRWLELANPSAAPQTVNVFASLRGADLSGMALSSDRTRAYIAVRFYDADAAAATGVRPTTDIAGGLMVVDTAALTTTPPTLVILQMVPLDRGVAQVRVIPRAGQRDLVVVESTDDSTLALFDDEIGAVVTTFAYCDSSPLGASAPGPCDPGAAILGANPFGLAVEPLANGQARLYVGSFDRFWVNVIQIDPAHPSAAPTVWIRIGPERTT